MEAVLALQRSAGNRAVSQALETSRRPMLARLSKDEVSAAFDNAGGTNRAAVPSHVIDLIASITTGWEEKVKDGARERRRARLSQGLATALSAFSGKEFPDLDDPESWLERMDRLVAAMLEEERKERAAIMEAGPPPLPVPGEGDVALGLRRVIHCTMGQGVIANLGRYTLYSDQFSTCSPVVMVNEQTLVGGLFHYGAGSSGQHAELAQMFTAIQPTYVGVNRRALTHGDGVGSTDDHDSLKVFFAQRLGFDLDQIRTIDLRSATYAVYFDDDDDGVTIESQPPREARTYDATHAKTSRQLNQEVSLLVNKDVYTTLFATKY